MYSADNKATVVFGGAFDPPHRGHVKIVRTLLRTPWTSGVIIVPSCRPPHKSTVASFFDRIAMCKRVFGRFTRVSIFNEDNGKPVTYTCDMVERLPGWGKTTYALALGIDEAAALGTWRSPEKIFSHAGLVVFGREGSCVKLDPKTISASKEVRSALEQAEMLSLPDGFGMSSTDVRKALSSSCQETARKLVNFRVWSYATRKGIY